MILKIPIEHVETIPPGLATNIHCNGIDLYLNDIRITKARAMSYDFVLLGEENRAGMANRGDLAFVTVIMPEALRQNTMDELTAKLAALEKLIDQYGEG